MFILISDALLLVTELGEVLCSLSRTVLDPPHSGSLKYNGSSVGFSGPCDSVTDGLAAAHLDLIARTSDLPHEQPLGNILIV